MVEKIKEKVKKAKHIDEKKKSVILEKIEEYDLGFFTVQADNIVFRKKKQIEITEKIVKQKQTLNKKLENILKKEQKRYDLTAAHEVDDKKVLKPRTKKPHLSSTKPKLAIIFDDVSTKSQVKAIKSLNLKLFHILIQQIVN